MPEPEQIAPIGERNIQQFVFNTDKDSAYSNPKLRELAERFCTGLFISVVQEEIGYLAYLTDYNKSPRVSVELFYKNNLGIAKTLPGYETAASAGAKAQIEDARRTARAVVRETNIDAHYIFNTLDGYFLDEGKLFGVLEKYAISSQSQRELLRRVFRNRYKKDLDAKLKESISGLSLERANAAIGADTKKYDAISLLAILGDRTGPDLERKVITFYRTRTKEEIDNFESLLKSNYAKELNQIFLIKIGQSRSPLSGTLNEIFQNILSTDARLIVDAHRAGDLDRIYIADIRGALSRLQPNRALAVEKLYARGPKSVPELVKKYNEVISEYGIGGSLKQHLMDAFEDVFAKGPPSNFRHNDKAIVDLVHGDNSGLIGIWTVNSIRSGGLLKSKESVNELLDLAAILSTSGDLLPPGTYRHFVVRDDRVQEIYKRALEENRISTDLFLAALDHYDPKIEKKLIDFLVSSPPECHKILVEQICSNQKISKDALPAFIHSKIGAEAAVNILSIILPEAAPGEKLDPYRSNVGGPLADLFAVARKESENQEQLKLAILKFKKDNPHPTAGMVNRIEALENLLRIYSDVHLLGLNEASNRAANIFGFAYAAFGVGATLGSGGAAAIPEMLARASIRSVTGQALKAGIAGAGSTFLIRTGIEGDRYQLNAENRRQLIKVGLMSIAARYSGAATGSVATNALGSRGFSALVSGASSGLAAGSVGLGFGDPIENLAWDLLVGAGSAVVGYGAKSNQRPTSAPIGATHDSSSYRRPVRRIPGAPAWPNRPNRQARPRGPSTTWLGYKPPEPAKSPAPTSVPGTEKVNPAEATTVNLREKYRVGSEAPTIPSKIAYERLLTAQSERDFNSMINKSPFSGRVTWKDIELAKEKRAHRQSRKQ